MLMDSSDFFGLNHYSTRKAGRPSVAVALGTLPREITSLWKSVGSAGNMTIDFEIGRVDLLGVKAQKSSKMPPSRLHCQAHIPPPWLQL